ncbi:PE family protein [Mycobacterium paragordonae]|nr:PE family protein [Mycobacterium paragordonae]
MSQVMAVPEFMVEAATDLKTIDSALQKAHTLAAGATLAVLPAAADEVSANIAQLFSDYGREYQHLAGQAGVFHERFVQNLNMSAGMYAEAEAVNTALLPLQPLISAVNSFIEASVLQGPLRSLWESIASQVFKTIVNNPLGGLVLGTALVGVVIAVLVFLAIAVQVVPPLFYFFGDAINPTLVALTAVA